MPIAPALLFDLDGTLVDSAVMIAQALSELAMSRGGALVPVERARQLVSKGAPTLVREALGPCATDADADVLAFRTILADIRAEPSIIFPGVVDALKLLTAAGHPCAIVTNKPEQLSRLLLDQLNLSWFFGAVVGGDSLAVCKPDPMPLHHALKTQGTEGWPALMIGDSGIDSSAAAAAGLAFLLFEGGYEVESCRPEQVTASFASFAQLPALVSKAFCSSK
jgi:phosphoglycolate phosphatase